MKLFYTTLFLFLLGGAASAQTTVAFTADKDNTIYSYYTANSNGAGEYLFVGKNAASNNNSVQRALLHFNLASIPLNANITAATLTFYVSKSAPSATGIELHKLNTVFGEGTSDAGGVEASGIAATAGDATWVQRIFPSTAWALQGGDFTAASSGGLSSIDGYISSATALTVSGAGLVADIQNWVNTPAGNFGWAMISNNEGLSASVKRIISRNSTVTAQRPSLSITYTAVLPITLRQFSGTIVNKQALLTWQTVSEVNNHHFTIEHSTDGTVFSVVGTVNAAANGSIVNKYTFPHPGLAAGNNFYRLGQHDLDGKSTYSQTILLNTTGKSAIKIVPNPATSVISLTAGYTLQGATYEIYSAAGQSVRKGTMSSQQINVSTLAAGQYFINIRSVAGEKTRQAFSKRE